MPPDPTGDSVLEPQVDPTATATPPAPGAPTPTVGAMRERLRAEGPVRSVGVTVLMVLAVVYALHAGRDFVLPVVFAILLNFLLSPVVRALHRLRIPVAAAAALVILLLCGLIGVGAYSLAAPANEWIAQAPRTFAKVTAKLRPLRRPVEQVSRTAEQVAREATIASSSRATEVVVRGPSVAQRFFGTTESLVTGVLEVVILLYFLLAAGDLFLQKLIRVLPQFRDKVKAVQIARQTESSISAYLFTVTVLNGVLGVVTTLLMLALGMPNPMLWGVLAGLLEFMPYIGATLMAGTLTIAGLAVFDSVGHALLVPASYFVVNFVQGNFISPLVLGRRLTLNPVAILLGLAFWWQLWGIAGAFVAVPLMATLKIFCDHIETLSPVGEFLGR